ncbi:MAG: hypothetical protein WCK41_11705 [Actinomycetes bacterium]
MPATDINQVAVDRLVERVRPALSGKKPLSAFSGTRGLSPTMVAIVAAIPTTVVVLISIVIRRPILLVGALMVMALTMFVIMTRVNATRVVAELAAELVVFSSRRGELSLIGRGDKTLAIGPARGRAWAQVIVAGETLWVSRPAFGGIVERLETLPSQDDPPLESM